MKDLQKLYNEALQEVKDANIEPGDIKTVKVNTRLKSTWGRCGYLNKQKNSYKIDINPILLADDVEDVAVKNTIIHEILHSCDGCMNHGQKWKAKANIINRKYPQYNIARTSSSEELGIDKEKRDYKYKVQCQKCQKIYGYYRISRVVKYPDYFKCKCGGKLKRLK
jgi:predicted SprT family Zn-dependent metalloprotease